jgi:hypothetical protein
MQEHDEQLQPAVRNGGRLPLEGWCNKRLRKIQGNEPSVMLPFKEKTEW